ncbi:unnamed protein product [Lymnaea stagnalis]|uniref:Citrate transporter-like domain-containing protein n=1 Tax=Lymnaea stagnalis TaxID=6523 RepID=A0AAV2IFV2_LYMST
MDTLSSDDQSSYSHGGSFVEESNFRRLRPMGNKRPQSAGDFQRNYGYGGSNEPLGLNLHINPKRVRNPRTYSMTSNSSLLTSDDTTLTQQTVDSDGHTSDGSTLETAPLLAERSRSSTRTTSLSNTLSMEINRHRFSLTNSVLIQDLMNSCHQQSKLSLLKQAKIFTLFVITLLCCAVIMSCHEENEVDKLAILPKEEKVVLQGNICNPDKPNVRLKLFGPFYTPGTINMTASRTTFQMNTGFEFNLTVNGTALHLGDRIEVVKDLSCTGDKPCNLTATSEIQVPVAWYTRELSWQLKNEVIYAFLVLGFVYILIIFELVHRTLAAMLGALAALAVLSSLNERPSLEVIIGWIDMETLSLLFGMMIIVAILSDTGFFDYSALKAYTLAKGKVWPLVTLLCVFSAVVSSFLDNVTTILLLAPVTIRLCGVLNLDPRRILIAEVLFSNIGGTATAIGDPPNVIIVGALSSHGITFSLFTMHMFPGIILVSVAGYGLLRFYYRNMNELKNKDPLDIAEMKHEVAMWKRAASRQQVITRDEMVMKALFLQKAVEIEHAMNKTLLRRRRVEEDDIREVVKKLESQYKIKDYALLVKSGLVLLVVIILLFIYSFVEQIHLDIGWIAVLGALWLLVLADVTDIDALLHKVEWSTLLFFAALFILMEALAELGMIKTIGNGIADIVTSVDKEHRLVLAVIVILWISAIASSFIDNIPYTTAMVPVLIQLSDNPEVNLPLVPLVTALAFGACLGGNGTLIGASCNVVCAGIAEQHGYGFTFWEFFKIGFPMMLVTTVASTVYVLLCHCVLDWNYV